MRIQSILPITVRLLLYLGKLDVTDLYFMTTNSFTSVDKIIETRCGTTQKALSFLLSFSNRKEIVTTANNNKAYYVELNAITDKGIITDTNHGFIMLNNEDWYIMDSYILHRPFTCKKINLPTTHNILKQLNLQYSNKLWHLLTDFNPKDFISKKVHISVYEYDYSFDNIIANFRDLIQQAYLKLLNDPNGTNEDYLYLLASDLNIKTASLYLNKLLQLSFSISSINT